MISNDGSINILENDIVSYTRPKRVISQDLPKPPIEKKNIATQTWQFRTPSHLYDVVSNSDIPTQTDELSTNGSFNSNEFVV